jgi:hypothetical protein
MKRWIAAVFGVAMALPAMAQPVSAKADVASPQATGCRAAPYSAWFGVLFETENHLDLGPYTTTTQCQDINIRSTDGAGFSACVIFIRHTTTCNYTTFVPANGQWVNIATTVLDGTVFNVRIFRGAKPLVGHSGVMDF